MIESARRALPVGIPLEFVIVDGGSTDGTIEWCKSQRDIRLIEHGALKGAINAFNDGAWAAKGKYVVLANDDVAFHENSLLLALTHLEEHPNCGAVAFEDNRPVPPYYPDNTQWHVLKVPATINGRQTSVPYAQVGMFRKWIGDSVNWWRGNDPRFAAARIYGGDNLLSANIWQLGYTVEAVEGCRVDDSVHEDELRAINRGKEGQWMANDDSKAYYEIFPNGPVVPDEPQLDQLDKRRLRILYLPIMETNQTPELGPTVQQQQKRGLREALAKVGWVYEFDYINVPVAHLRERLGQVLKDFQPDILFGQFHGADRVTYDMLHEIRQRYPAMMVINWNGDTHRSNLTNPTMMKFLSLIDLQLTVNHSVVSEYQENGIVAAYWQCAFEPVEEPLPFAHAYDVVFQGTNYAEQRGKMGVMLKEMLGDKFGVWGDWWDRVGVEAQGRTLYDFKFSTALYRNSKIAIGSNEFPDDYGFISNRVWEAMAAGGCVYMMQHVPGLEELTGLKAGEHYVEWKDLTDLQTKVEYYLDRAHEAERRTIADSGTQFVREHHNFDERVRVLFTDLLPLAKKKLQKFIGLRYTGRMDSQFGVMGRNSRHYLCEPNETLYVMPEDADWIVQQYGVFEVTNGVAENDTLAKAANYG